MILLSGNIGALMEVILIMSTIIFIPFALLSWYLFSRTKLYKERYLNGNRSTKFILAVGIVFCSALMFVLIAYSIFKTIVS